MLQGECEEAKRLLTNAKSSAAVASRLAEEGTAVEVSSGNVKGIPELD